MQENRNGVEQQHQREYFNIDSSSAESNKRAKAMPRESPNAKLLRYIQRLDDHLVTHDRYSEEARVRREQQGQQDTSPEASLPARAARSRRRRMSSKSTTSTLAARAAVK